MKYSDLDQLVGWKEKLEKISKLRDTLANSYKTINLVVEGEEVSLHKNTYMGMSLRQGIIEVLDRELEFIKSKMMLLGVDDFNQ